MLLEWCANPNILQICCQCQFLGSAGLDVARLSPKSKWISGDCWMWHGCWWWCGSHRGWCFGGSDYLQINLLYLTIRGFQDILTLWWQKTIKIELYGYQGRNLPHGCKTSDDFCPSATLVSRFFWAFPFHLFEVFISSPIYSEVWNPETGWYLQDDLRLDVTSYWKRWLSGKLC